MPPNDIANDWIDIKAHLQEAQKHFVNREYRACVSVCRDVIQETGEKRFGQSNWASPLLDKIGKSRMEMNKEEREGALWGALRHYTHQAHHPAGEGGEKNYTRSEAKLSLVLAAAFVAHG